MEASSACKYAIRIYLKIYKIAVYFLLKLSLINSYIMQLICQFAVDALHSLYSDYSVIWNEKITLRDIYLERFPQYFQPQNKWILHFNAAYMWNLYQLNCLPSLKLQPWLFFAASLAEWMNDLNYCWYKIRFF